MQANKTKIKDIRDGNHKCCEAGTGQVSPASVGSDKKYKFGCRFTFLSLSTHKHVGLTVTSDIQRNLNATLMPARMQAHELSERHGLQGALAGKQCETTAQTLTSKLEKHSFI